MKTSHRLWTWIFLPLTAVAVIGELVAAFDTTDVTAPWTDYITTYLPPWLTFGLVGVLTVWLPIHFWLEYKRRGKVP